MAAEMNRHLGEAATLLPRKNPNYDPDLVRGGFQMVKGGYLAGGSVSSGIVTVVLDLEQPGRMQISDPKLISAN